MSSLYRNAITGLWLPVACAATPAAVAQQTVERSTTVLQEIVVTAQKREERLLEVPIAISAFTNQNLVDSGASQLADFLERAPGVGIVDNQSGTQTIQVRGISSTYGNATVGYYLDELPFTYIGNTQVPDIRTYDLERVEILRGPQGTLYGDGSIGGTIRILTYEPNLDTFDGSLDVDGSSTAGGDDSWAARGMLNVPFGDGKAGMRLVASREDFGGWVDNSVTGEKDQNSREIDNYRAKFRLKPTEKLDIILSGWFTRNEATGNADSLPDYTTPVPPDDYETEYDLYSLTVRYSFDAFDLVSATSQMDYKNDYISEFFAAPFTIFEDQDLLSQEFRLTSTGDGNMRWTAGLFYRDIDRRTLVNLEAFALTQDQTQESESYAVFGELTWPLLDGRLDLTLGARYSEDDRLFSEPVDPALLEFLQTINPDFSPTVTPKFDSFNPRLNLAYRFDDDWLGYFNVAKGFRTGQAQPVISLILSTLAGVELPTAIDPEEVWSYEIGTKGSFWDGRGVLEAAVFYNDWKDIQTLVTLTQPPQPPVAGLVNGGTAETMGIEVGLTLLPVDGLTLQVGGGVIHAEYTEDIPGTPVQDGDRIVAVPEVTASASATYRWSMTDSLDGFALGSVQYVSDRENIASGFLSSDYTTTMDLRLGVERGGLGVYVYGENLTDEDGAVSPAPPPAGPDGIATRFRPRTFGLNLRYDFR